MAEEGGGGYYTSLSCCPLLQAILEYVYYLEPRIRLSQNHVQLLIFRKDHLNALLLGNSS